MAHFSCPHCAHVFQLTDTRLAGKQTECPTCHKPIAIPELPSPARHVKQASNNRSSIPTWVVVAVGSIVGIPLLACGGCLFLRITTTSQPVSKSLEAPKTRKSTQEEKRQQRGATSTPSSEIAKEEPIGTEARLRHVIADALGTSNRNVQKVSRLDVSSGNITVTIAFDDNLTENFIRGGIRRDIVDVLKAARDSGYEFSEIHIDGSFPLVDKFGATTEETVVRVQYARATVDRINWSGFLPENVYDIADSCWLHPAIRK